MRQLFPFFGVEVVEKRFQNLVDEVVFVVATGKEILNKLGESF